MPFQLPQLSFAIECDEKELETFDVKQEGSLITAFVASEAGKRFRIMYRNHLLDLDLAVHLRIDGKLVDMSYLQTGQLGCLSGIHNSTSILPFMFQELELVDPNNADMEDGLVMPEMGTIEVRAFRARYLRTENYTCKVNYELPGGRVSERSKKAGWHHVSTADETPTNRRMSAVSDKIDPPNAPCATFKIFYRPRELLMAQGIIPRLDVAARTSGGSGINDRKCTREDELPGPSKQHAAPTTKNEDMSFDARAQRIRDLQAELNSLIAEHSSSSVKCELGSVSPIVVGEAADEVIDLTLED